MPTCYYTMSHFVEPILNPNRLSNPLDSPLTGSCIVTEEGLSKAITQRASRRMFKIGDFSKLSRVSVKALRYYDEIGLLPPAQIDRWTGYRYYTPDQLPRLNRILALKDLGFALEQIAQLLDGDLPAAQIRGMLIMKRAEIQREVGAAQEQLARIEARLRLIEQENAMPSYEVILKPVEKVRVAGVQGVVPDETVIGPTFNRLFDEVEHYVQRHGAGIAGPGIALYHDTMEGGWQDVRVAAAFPVRDALPDGEQVHVHDLPAATMASVVHHGSFDSLGPAYQAVLNWIEQNGYRINGPSREVYLQYERTGDPAQYVTEIQVPVEKA
jgi:DNA-binding transcriptional MerR regulator